MQNVKRPDFQSGFCGFESRLQYQVSVSGGSERNKMLPHRPFDKWSKSLPFHGKVTGSNPVWVTEQLQKLLNFKNLGAFLFLTFTHISNENYEYFVSSFRKSFLNYCF